jgi:hypothetical protein
VDGGELGQGTLGIVETEPAVLMRVARLAAFESEGEAQEGDEENDGRAMALLHGRLLYSRGREDLQETAASWS